MHPGPLRRVDWGFDTPLSTGAYGGGRDKGGCPMAVLADAFPPQTPFGSRTLFRGRVGSDVAVLQTVYNQCLKVMDPPGAPLGRPIPVTGVYDGATTRAVRNLQAYFGIAADGVAGPDTYFLFGHGVERHVTYGGPRYGSRPLRPGMTGGDVTVLQNRLNLFRYSRILDHPADGTFGPRTAAAVRAFAADAGTDGNPEPRGDGAWADTCEATCILTYAGGRTLLDGRDGLDVVFIQLLLRTLGFYTGPIHGLYSPGLQAAVLRLQESAGIAADGVVGTATYLALGRLNHAPAPSPMPLPCTAPPPARRRVLCWCSRVAGGLGAEPFVPHARRLRIP